MAEDENKRDEDAEPPSSTAAAARPASRDDGEGWLVRTLRSVFGSRPESIRTELMQVLAEGAPTGFSPRETEMLRNILALQERRLEDVMIPRADIVAVPDDVPIGELITVFREAAHSRLVVHGESLDNPLGLVHIRDLLAYLATCAAPAAGRPEPVGDAPAMNNVDLAAIDFSTPLARTAIMRKILFAPPSMSAVDLLARMQTSRTHLAVIIDEFGGTDGLVSIEDLVEQIVGNIEDEHDEVVEHIVTPQADGSYVVDGRTKLEQVAAALGPEFEVAEASEEVDTLGGLLASKLGRVPARGDVIRGPGPFEAEVLDATPRFVKRVRVRRLEALTPGAAQESDSAAGEFGQERSGAAQPVRRRRVARRS